VIVSYGHGKAQHYTTIEVGFKLAREMNLQETIHDSMGDTQL